MDIRGSRDGLWRAFCSRSPVPRPRRRIIPSGRSSSSWVSRGAAMAAKSDPDGYTLLVTPGGHALFGAVFQSLPFDTVDSFSWISNVINVPFFAVVRADSKFQSMAALIAEARTAPEKISFGSAGPGSTHHLVGEMLGAATGAKFLHVPYRGDAPVINALLGGEIN